ncbi:hypothetical protein GGS24DRAFT_462434 [Hypoxylon argillaceum]|nr:hypothetical protein GGS24DRAFT_462434 [Hypoxylon argillaceum]
MTNRHVGCGLTDHDIWGTRFVFRKGHAVAKIEHQALRLQRMVRMTTDPKSLARKIDCLVNITVNAPSFLGQQAYEFPVKFIDENDEIVTEKKFLETEAQEMSRGTSTEKVMVQVVYCFPSEGLIGGDAYNSDLYDSKVLNLPKPVPTIQVRKKDTSIYTDHMEKIASEIMNQLRPRKENGQRTSTIPRVSRAPFGVVAHKVGPIPTKLIFFPLSILVFSF